ncbi:putative dehydrogenase [Rathayibacter sp. PhB93]|uniref:Gfo/Idh/MocA family protein n=1 Tax=unclassified Rathayibacter TaxID=2609250 RepID=UPI000F9632A7|nr:MULTISPECIES: Gfo/Idh/MocA family oxidoreductase [unclassified Rathayibacter]ROQ00938.1 putative dehydrogenase [Rathayibacter sp. PhB93]TDQ07292.1 putative dehydrogenase [Rathayibacter sp. PhB1]
MTASATPLAWGIVGTGAVSRFLCSDLAQVDTARLRAVCSRSLVTATEFRDEHAAERAYGDLDRMLEDDELDIVYIGTPHATHLPIALAALRAGKHVLIEKPIGLDAEEARMIADAARRADRFAMEGMWMKFAPAYRQLLSEVRAGAIGEVRSIRASFGLPFDVAESTRWSTERASSTLLDQGIYPVTLALDLLGAPWRIRADRTLRHDGVDLTTRASFEYSGGRFADLAASMVEYIDPTASINGMTGWIDIAAPFWATTRFTTHTGSIPEALGSPTTTLLEAEGYGYVPMLRAVTEAVTCGALEHPLHTLEASVRTLAVLDRIRSAARAA